MIYIIFISSYIALIYLIVCTHATDNINEFKIKTKRKKKCNAWSKFDGNFWNYFINQLKSIQDRHKKYIFVIIIFLRFVGKSA